MAMEWLWLTLLRDTWKIRLGGNSLGWSSTVSLGLSCCRPLRSLKSVVMASRMEDASASPSRLASLALRERPPPLVGVLSPSLPLLLSGSQSLPAADNADCSLSDSSTSLIELVFMLRPICSRMVLASARDLFIFLITAFIDPVNLAATRVDSAGDDDLDSRGEDPRGDSAGGALVRGEVALCSEPDSESLFLSSWLLVEVYETAVVLILTIEAAAPPSLSLDTAAVTLVEEE